MGQLTEHTVKNILFSYDVIKKYFSIFSLESDSFYLTLCDYLLCSKMVSHSRSCKFRLDLVC